MAATDDPNVEILMEIPPDEEEEKEKQIRARLRWAYDNEEGLLLDKGEQVLVLNLTDPEWWEIETLLGEKLFVPSSYLKVRVKSGKSKDAKQKVVTEWCDTWNEQKKNQPPGRRQKKDYVARKKLESLPPGLVIERLQQIRASQMSNQSPLGSLVPKEKDELCFDDDGTNEVLQEYLGKSRPPLAPSPDELNSKSDQFASFLKNASHIEIKTRLQKMIASVDSEKWKRGNFSLAVAAANLTIDHLVEIDILARGFVYSASVHETLESLLQVFIGIEVRNSEDSLMVFRANSLATKALGEFLWMYGAAYLNNLLKPIIFSVVHGDHTFEVNPDVIKNEKHLAENQQNLTASFEMTMSKICNCVWRVPPFIRRVCQRIAEVVAMKFEPNIPIEVLESPALLERPSVRTALANFFLLRFICPAIIDPMTFKVWTAPQPPIPRKARVALLYVAKAVQIAGQGGVPPKGTKSSHASCLDPIIARDSDKLLSSIAQIANLSHTIGPDVSPGEEEPSRSSVVTSPRIVSSSGGSSLASASTSHNQRISRRLKGESKALKSHDSKAKLRGSSSPEVVKVTPPSTPPGLASDAEEDAEFYFFIQTLVKHRASLTEEMIKYDPDWIQSLGEVFRLAERYLQEKN